MNLLFIFTDQQQRDALGCMGNADVDTPNLDALAARGVLFRRAYSNNPICTPFRINLMTGQYSCRTGAQSNRDRVPPGTPTLAGALERGGVRAGYVGKWHIGGTGNGAIPRELRAGFQRFIGYQCYNGFHENVCFYDEDGVEHRFDKHRTEATTDLAVQRLRDLAGGPFALFVSYQAPHYPVQPGRQYAEMYAGRPIHPRPNRGEVEPYTPTWSPTSPQDWEQDPDYRRYGGNLDEYIRLYDAMVTQIDANVGRLLRELEDLGLADETAVVFTSDHGDMQGSHGLTNKCLPYEESAGIPLIARVPGGAAGATCDVPVGGVDLFPTCLALCGLPADRPTADGRSIAPAVTGQGRLDPGREVFSERPKWCMVVRDGWKLVADRDASYGLAPCALFDLDHDPYELSNRIDEPALAGRAREMTAALAAWQADCRRHPTQAH
jgi:arylsulfatase A-like enzyme